MLTRRQFLAALATAGASAGGAGAYARWCEPSWLAVTERIIPPNPRSESITTPHRPDREPVRLLHLSDLHVTTAPESLARVTAAITAGLALKPDLACITGDFVTAARRFDAAGLHRELARLSAAIPTFGVLGNHDGGEFTGHFGGESSPTTIGTLIERAGLHWLDNRRHTLVVRGRSVELIGTGDLWNGRCRPEIAWQGHRPDPEAMIVALSHNPDAKRFLAPHPWHLLLCGHTHGGQLWPAVLGRFTAPVEDKRFIAGLLPYEGRWVHITRGVGCLHEVRILCRPEINLLRLT